MNIKLKNKGITLISLIVTVIILLILAGVSISYIVNNFIIDKSKTAINKYKESENEYQKRENDIYGIVGNEMGQLADDLEKVDETYSITINYKYAVGEEGEAPLPETHKEKNLKPGYEYSISAPAIEGYVAIDSILEGTIKDCDIEKTVIYYRDELSEGKGNIYNSDGIPDVCQALIKYDIENGQAEFYEVVVTLYDENGKFSKDGIGYLREDQIPEITANNGYDQGKFQWIGSLPTEPISGNTTFTGKFEESANKTVTVRYLENGTGREILSAKVIGGLKFGQMYTEYAISIAGYSLKSPSEQTIQITNGENVIIFYYSETGPEVEPTSPTTPY